MHGGAEHFTLYQLAYKLVETEEPFLKRDPIRKRDTSQLRFELHAQLGRRKNVIDSNELGTADLPWGLFGCRFHRLFSENMLQDGFIE